MADDVLLNKSATIERCVGRAREEYDRAPATFSSDFTRQDAAMMNIQRACEASLDIGQYLIRRDRLGVAQSARDVFEILANHRWIEKDLAESLKRMIGFRNIAVHDYQKIILPITIRIITEHLDEFLQFSTRILKHDALKNKYEG